MLWPFILPFKITFYVLLVAIISLTLFSIPRTWSRSKTFFLSTLIAMIAFVPSCTGIMIVVDTFRFGDFHYDSYNDVSDFRSQRYLPELATDIHMRKHANGYRAHYHLSEVEFHEYLDGLWEQYGKNSAVGPSGYYDDGRTVTPEMFKMMFDGLGWECPANAIVYYSPSEADGGGATYYFDADARLVFQRTGFW